MRLAVTGASRGIGLALAEVAVRRGDSVVALARDPERSDALSALKKAHPDRVLSLVCDVGDEASVRAMAAKLTGPLDALINNAGIGGKRAKLAELDLEDVVKTYRVNALGALSVTRALLPHLREGKSPKVLNVSTGLASISDNTSGGSWGYRLSKAALNMATMNLAHELRGDGIACAAVNPGWVRTDMGGSGARHGAEETAERLLGILDRLGLEESGSFYNWDGKPYPW